MKVSIILPNYNYSRYLKARIEGILNQTYQNFELILLDDKSTDNSVEIINEYKDNPHVTHVVVNKENSGSPFQQWMRGIALAQGEYIWIAEADDLAKPEFLQQCVEVLDQHPTASLCYAYSEYIDENGDNIPRKKRNGKLHGYSLYDGQEFVRFCMYWRCYIENASAVLFRKSYYEKCDMEKCLMFRSSGDWLFWTNMVMQGEIVKLHSPLNIFRQSTQSVSKQAKTSGLSFVEDACILSEITKRLGNVGILRQWMRAGQLYRLIHKSHLPKDVEQKVCDDVKLQLGISRKARTLESIGRLLRWIPGVPTMKNDSLPDAC